MRLIPKKTRYITAFLVAIIAVITSSIAYIEISSSKYSSRSLDLFSKQRSNYTQSCLSGEDLTRCLFIDAIDMARDTSISKGMDFLALQAERDDFFEKECHDLAHTFGQIAYIESGISILNKSSGACAWGLVHGALAYWAKHTDYNVVKKDLKTVCDMFAKDGEAGISMCAHGAGHAISAALKSWEDGSQLCVTSFIEPNRGACLSGSIMEYTWQRHLTYKSSLNEVSSEIIQCRELVDTETIFNCASAFGILISDATNSDYQAASEFCLSLTGVLIDGCAHGLGLTAYIMGDGTPETTVAFCAEINDRNIRSYCAAGAVKGTTNTHAMAFGEGVCAMIDLPAQDRCRALLPKLSREIDSLLRVKRGF